MLDFGGQVSGAGSFGNHSFAALGEGLGQSVEDFSGLGASHTLLTDGFEFALPTLGDVGGDDGWMM